jgi:predicted RNA binding protein YcfA (HicA-like mRNA interferase family)
MRGFLKGIDTTIRREADLKVRDAIKLIEDDGWYVVARKGDHQQFKHATKPGRVTIAGHPGDDLATGTLSSILRQAQLKKEKE